MPNFVLPDPSIALLAGLLLLVVVTWLGIRRLRRVSWGGTPAVRVAAVAAVACTAYSADTSWRFAANYLDMGSTAERVAMFAAAELALFANSLLARQNLSGPNGTPGAPGVLVWVITGVQIIPAYAESGVIGGTVRAFVGPIMAAMLWHLAMGIELRHRKPDAESHGLTSMLGRELRERVLSRLGIAERDRNAAQITRDRATARAVALAARLAEQTPEQRGSRRGQRLARRLSVAVARASVGTEREQRRKLLDQLAVRRHAGELATITLASPWGESATDPVATALMTQTREEMRRATDSIRQRSRPSLLFVDADDVAGHEVNTPTRSPGHPATGPENDSAPDKLSTPDAQAVIEEGWADGLSVRSTAKRATRAPSYVHKVFVRLDEERGARPSRGQLALLNGHADSEPDASEQPANKHP